MEGLEQHIYNNGVIKVTKDTQQCLQKAETSSRILTLPTILTLARVVAIPVLVAVFYMEHRWATMTTASIFIAAAITDWLDGYIARKMGSCSAFGAFLDPVADKITISAVREWAASQGGDLHELVAVHNLGKLKTTLQMVALTFLMVTRDSSYTGAGDLAACGVAMLYVSACIGLWTLAAYMKSISVMLLKQK
ncbi:CDP-diacylglycerol--glycerol-3-phosphate 3-phosphatidyltransferase 1, chloroplastic isoform X2 [Cryptomeria japonica]|uniref:CDP-diacylglycerol--glycerol-3-phosphate 3-phosphatidyltransferase 1, chloroplastic isoform X2 n=1 Tax=Cryptomeria japonica TaxID=3369 RepID=UPI0025AD404B|nr:CDP-diacylglycerol--glycerol-3-phosphate 3-phosphatidyltransferase 1, chloroplastic isoform X2 [Cryptomeria japonica]